MSAADEKYCIARFSFKFFLSLLNTSRIFLFFSIFHSFTKDMLRKHFQCNTNAICSTILNFPHYSSFACYLSIWWEFFYCLTKCTTEIMWLAEKHFRAYCLLCIFLFLSLLFFIFYFLIDNYMFWQTSRWLCWAFFN